MTTLFQRTNFYFKAIEPSKKYIQFSYQELTFNEVNVGDCFKDTILKIDDAYYLFTGDKNFNSPDENQKSKIIFKNKHKIIHEKEA